MLDNLWRTFGFGTPITVNQMLGRAVICIAASVFMIIGGFTTTVIEMIFIVMLGIVAGFWLGRIMGWINDKMLLEATENIASILKPIAAQTPVLDPDVDYVVNPGEPCWITVGNYSVRIVQRDGGDAAVQVFHLNREDEAPLNSFEG